jgi:hypothetical protein
MATGLRLGKDRLREISKALLTQIVHGKRSIEEGLAIIGGQAVGMIQKTIAEGGHFQELAQSTLNARRSRMTVSQMRKRVAKLAAGQAVADIGLPLNDTANMKQSITYTVQSREGTHAS